LTQTPDIEADDEEIDEDEAEIAEADRLESDRREQESEEEPGRSRRRRKRRKRRDDEPGSSPSTSPTEVVEEARDGAGEFPVENGRAGGDDGDGDGKSDAERRRRRGRRGGRRRPRREVGSEPALGEPRSPPDLVEILSTANVEEREDASAEPVASAPIEARAAEIEHTDAPEFVSATQGAQGGIEIVREIEPVIPERAAGGIRAEVSERIPGGTSGLEAASYLRSLAATTERQETDRSPAMPAAEIPEGPPVSASEPVREQPSSDAARPPDPDPHAQQVGEKPANPRRGWWQRLIQS
jgi:ribonuclease E